jgi:hypothetical protein
MARGMKRARLVREVRGLVLHLPAQKKEKKRREGKTKGGKEKEREKERERKGFKRTHPGSFFSFSSSRLSFLEKEPLANSLRCRPSFRSETHFAGPVLRP